MLEEGRSLELQLEKDKDTEMKVARFYEGGVEIVFDNKIEASAIFDEARDSGQPEEDDVVIEEENVIEAESLDQNKNVTKAVYEKKNMTKEQRRMVEATLRLYTGGIERIEAENHGATGTDVKEKFKKVGDELIENTLFWVPSTEKHEDKDVTLNIPLKGNNSMQTSFDFDIVQYM